MLLTWPGFLSASVQQELEVVSLLKPGPETIHVTSHPLLDEAARVAHNGEGKQHRWVLKGLGWGGGCQRICGPISFLRVLSNLKRFGFQGWASVSMELWRHGRERKHLHHLHNASSEEVDWGRSGFEEPVYTL